VPFTGLMIEPDGKVGFCRMKGSEFAAGNLHHQSLLEIWNGAVVQAWRQEFLDGNPTTCQREMRHRQCHKCTLQNMKIPKSDATVIQTRMPRRIAFNLNGKCNLSCIMCEIWQKPNGFYDTNGFWDQLDDLIVDLEEVELLSGEPFIQKDTYRLIDFISKRRPDCKWTLTTNNNWKMNAVIRSHLDQIKIRNVIVSLDSVNPVTYPLIRKKGNLALALQTLRDLLDYEKSRLERGLSGLQIQVNFLIQKANWSELKEIAAFQKEYGVQIFRTFLYEPSHLSLLSLSEAERIQIIETYRKELSPEDTTLNIILPILDSLPKIYKAQYFLHLQSLGKETASLENLAQS